MQERGIEESLKILTVDIDSMLAGQDIDNEPLDLEDHPADGDAEHAKQWGPPTRAAVEAQKEYGNRFKVGQGVQ